MKNIEEILNEIAVNAAKALTEAAANRPLDQGNGDPTGAPALADPAGGAAGIGAPAARPADNTGNGDPAPAPVAIEVVQPVNTNGEPVATGPKTVGKGATELEPSTKGLSEAFTKHLNDAIVEFKVDIAEAAKPILESMQLDEEFAKKALELFESAINTSAVSHLTAINGKAGVILESLLETQFKLMEDKADKYMESVVSEWTQENRLAIEQGIRTQIAESFMDKLKGLLESHYVELPAGKKDLYEHAIEKGEQILESFNSEKEKSVSLEEEVAGLKRALFVEQATRGLVATKAEKVRSLAESLSVDGNFESAVAALVEEVNKPASAAKPAGQHVTQDPIPLNESANDKPAAKTVVDPTMAAAHQFLKRR